MPNVITDELLDDAGAVIGNRIKQAVAQAGGSFTPVTKDEIEALAENDQIQPLKAYLIVDELRLAIGILGNVYQEFALKEEVATSSGAGETPSLIALSWATNSGSGGFIS